MTQTSLWRRWFIIGLPLLAIVAISPQTLASFSYAQNNGESCTPYILEAEQEYDIPQGLLLAIALVESGRKGKPYPWAININGKGHYAQNTEDALQRIKDRRGNVRRNTMAGCMQLSVFLHGRSFNSVEEVFDPRQNVFYAAQYLARHYRRFDDWVAAVKRYHGGTPAQKRTYACKVWHTFKKLNGSDAAAFTQPSCKMSTAAAIAPEVHNVLQAYQIALAP